MATFNPGYGASELFTYSRIEPVKVVDLERRLAKAAAPDNAEARIAWALLARDAEPPALKPADLSFDYAAHLKDWRGLEDGLPARAHLRDPDSFASAAIARDAAYRGDLQRAEMQFLALAVDPKAEEADRQNAARLLQFVERFPDLARTPAQVFFAPVLARRPEPRPKPRKALARPKADDPEADKLQELGEMVRSIETLWQARNDRVEHLKETYQALRRQRGAMVRTAHATSVQAAGKPEQREARAERTVDTVARTLRTERRQISASIEKARRDWQDALSAGQVVERRPKPGTATADPTPPEVADLIARLDALKEKHQIPEGSYCQMLTELLSRMDQIDRKDPTRRPEPVLAFEDSDAPRVSFTDNVQMLGKAELVRVEEEFVGYSAAEISYVQTAMIGERRLRKTSSEHMQETLLEQVDETTGERGDETSATTKSALRSEIESELRSRFDSNLAVSGSGSGGGTVGVVNFSGSGSASAGLGLGIDTGVRSQNTTEFSVEIVRKAVERTTQRTLERRVSRSTNTYSKLDEYEIVNETGKPINGVYVFLNKHIAVTETIYGVRAFLEAKVLTPGRALIAAKESRRKAAIDEMGERPRFDITPDQITPANYMRLVGQFRASNVEPPPPAISRLTRVYKTDTTSKTSDSDSFKGNKIADVLVPFYGKYQRFAITDNVDLPEGYGVLDVDVAISHGANGVSLPAHLPLTLPGAAMYAATSFAPFAMGLLGIAFLPAWIWSVAYAASPILHYNTDSSNVTVTIGTEGQDSPYYFFEPDDLLDIVMELLQAISNSSPALIESLQALANQRLGEVQTAALALPAEIGTQVATAIEGAVGRIKTVLELLAAGDLTGATSEITNVGSVSLSIELTDEMNAVFAPVTGFISDLSGLLQDEVADAIQLALSEVLSRMENNQRLEFIKARGAQGKLPIAVNALALNPGVTVTVSACLLRTREGMAKWQLRTFESFYQSHLQQLAAWESQFYSDAPRGLTRSPGMMRRDERVALKERVIAALNALHPGPDGTIDIERLELFEHAIDWESLSFRLFDYGPTEKGLKLENSGLLADTDEDRRRFLLSSWAQVMVPLQPHDGLTAQFFDFLDGGGGRVADAISDDPAEIPETDELTALYRDLVLSRSLIGDNPPPGEPRFMTLPTDLIALNGPDLDETLPRNPNFP